MIEILIFTLATSMLSILVSLPILVLLGWFENSKPYKGPTAEPGVVVPLFNFWAPDGSITPLFNFNYGKPQVPLFNFYHGKG